MDKFTKERIIESLLSRFLLVTFTDAAAKEMRSRLAGAFLEEGYDIDAEKIPAMTFNAIDMDLIARFYEELGYSKVPMVIDTNPTAEAAKVVPLITGDNVVPDLKYDIPLEFYTGEKGAMGALIVALKVFEVIRTAFIDPDADNALQDLMNEIEADPLLQKRVTVASCEDLLEKYKTYSEILKTEGMLTFADQEPLGISLLELHPEYLKNLGIEHVVVDEFQDSNDVNMEFVKKLIDNMVGNGGTIKSIMVIGDDAQSIYAFRSAVVQNMTEFDKKIGKESTKLNMTENYRSYSEIVDPANKLINLNKNKIEKPLNAAKGIGGFYTVQAFYNPEKEQEWILNEIETLIAAGYDPKDIAIIARTKKPLVAMQSALTKRGEQCAMMCPVKMLDDSRIQAAIALTDAYYDPEATRSYKIYLNALCEELEGKSLRESMSAEEYLAAIDLLKQKFLNIEDKKPQTVLYEYHEYLESINNGEIYQKWLDMLYDEEKKAEKGETEAETSINKMAAALKFVRDFKRYGQRTEAKMDDRYEGVVLTTAHSSKGLEWKVVFNMISEYDNIYLHGNRRLDEIEETRRLLFVSMTRAMERLYVTGRYLIASNKEEDVPNQFLRSLYGFDNMEWDTVDPEAVKREEERKKRRAEQAKAKREAIKELISDPNAKKSKEYSYNSEWFKKKHAQMAKASVAAAASK